MKTFTMQEKGFYGFLIFLVIIMFTGMTLGMNADKPVDGYKAPTEVSGTITADTVWTQEGSPYIIRTTVTVPEGIRVTVEPGVRVHFVQNQGMIVRGTLEAIGSSSDPIVFTGTVELPGWWRSINIQNQGSAVLKWCEVSFAGTSDQGAILKSGSGFLELSDSTVRRTAGDGLRISSGYSSFVSQNNEFLYNTNGVRVGINVSFLDLTSSFSGNIRDIYLDGGTINTLVKWGASSSYSLFVSGDITVVEGGRLEIAPGSVLKFDQNRRLFVRGYLEARGLKDQQIHFTDTRDNTVGGVLAGQEGSMPESGWWRSINIQNEGSAFLEWCVISYGGRSDGAAVLKAGTGSLVLQNSVVKNSSSEGLRIAAGYSLFEHGKNSYVNNAIGVRVGVNASFFDLTTVFEDNGIDVHLDGGTINTEVRWGAHSDYSMTVTGYITVAENARLEVLPGTVVKFRQGLRLTVSGSLFAKGEEERQIYFTDIRDDSAGGDANRDQDSTSPEPGWWRSIMVQQNGTADFAWCVIGYGGLGDNAAVLKTSTGAVSIANSIIHNSSGDGVRIDNAAGGFQFSDSSAVQNIGAGLHYRSDGVSIRNSVFTLNGIGIRKIANASLFVDESTIFAGNQVNIQVDGGTVSGDVVWSAPGDISVFLGGYTSISRDGKLTLGAGTVVKLAQNTQIRVEGDLVARGTEDRQIFFTDLRDDSVGGDDNRDDDSSFPQPGWWRSIYILNEGSADLEWCVISYAGSSDGAAIFKSGSGSLRLANSTIADTAGDGLRVNGGYSLFENENNVFRNNTNGIRVGINASFYDMGTIFEDNVVDVYLDGGSIDGPVKWGAGSDCSVVLAGDITIRPEGSLEILPGTVLRLTQFRRITVNGYLKAQGNEGFPVYITDIRDDSAGGSLDSETSIAEPGWWRSIYIQNEGSADLEWCVISYGGRSDGAALTKTGSGHLKLVNSVIKNSESAGLRIFEGYSGFEHGDNWYVSNSVGVRVGINASFADLSSSFEQNGSDLLIDGGTINTAVKWGAHSDYSMLVTGDVTVSPGAVLEILPGTIVKFSQYRRIVVSGHLSALGEQEEQIYFTDLRDDTAGGDTNSDSDSSAPGPGWWRSISVQDSGSAELQWCNVFYAGYADRAGVLKTGDGALSLTDSRISGIAGDGLHLRNNTGTIEVMRCSFDANINGVALSQENRAITLEECILEGNSEFGVRNDSSTEIVAVGCWWGSITGPYHISVNPRGEGDVVSDRVVFDPWIGKDEIDWESIEEEEYEFDDEEILTEEVQGKVSGWRVVSVKEYCLIIPVHWNDFTEEDRKETEPYHQGLSVLGTWSAGSRYGENATTAAVYSAPIDFIEDLLEDFRGTPGMQTVRHVETQLVGERANFYIFEQPGFARAYISFISSPDDQGKHTLLLAIAPFEELPSAEGILDTMFTSFCLCDDPSSAVSEISDLHKRPTEWYWYSADGLCVEIPGDWYDNTEFEQYYIQDEPDVKLIAFLGDEEYGDESIQFVIWRVTPEELSVTKEELKEDLQIIEESEATFAERTAYWLMLTEPEYNMDRLIFAHHYETDSGGFALTIGVFVKLGHWEEAELDIQRILESLHYCDQ